MSRSTVSRPLTNERRVWLLCLLALLAASFAPAGGVPQALAQAAPDVRYDAIAKIVYVGANYTPGTLFAGYPSHPDAPKQPITVPALAQSLTAIGQPNLLVDQGGGAWLLRSDVVISPTARLDATAPSISALRLDSTPDRFPALTRLVATGGHLLIQGISVVSWDNSAGAVDAEYLDGRSYLLAQTGGRLDIIDADVSYLGWGDGEPSGLSWRKRATKTDPKTGATGSILRSNIHNNYFGQYSYEAYGLQVFNNKFHHNVAHGLAPNDYSMNFVVAYNQIYNNGKHGINVSRGCELNWIHHNEVYGNLEHVIMLGRGSNNNKLSDNLVYNNRDGIAIFQSSNNLIQDNTLRDNERGIRINATYDANDIFDGFSISNTMLENRIENNSQYGIYLYERADKNTIARNTIVGSASSGIYIKTGANKVDGNTLRDNGHGITIIGTESYVTPAPGGPPYVAPESQPGLKNVLIANSIEDNANAGIQIKGGVDTQIGPRTAGQNPEQANLIRTNGTYGIALTDGSVDNQAIGNTIHGNGRDGVLIKGLTTLGNLLSRNSIAANADRGIALSDGANAGILPPTISSAPEAAVVTGTAPANATVEIYRDANGQGRVYKGTTTAASNGAWSFALPTGDDPQEGFISALTINRDGNSSSFASNAPITLNASYTVGAGRNGEPTVFISGPGANVTLPEIQAALQVISPTVTLLDNQGSGVWQANASLFLNRGVTLTLTTATVSWFKLRSQGEAISLAAEGDPSYNYRSFTTLRTYSGAILIDGVRVTSWDPAANTYDLDVSNGRSYLLAKYDARMDIANAELSYLGSADGESYGIAWRDINDSEAPDALRTRVTGQVTNSVFSYNYYGIYTYQAANMLFRGNKFHNNIGYGFDPHDFSHHFVVENNEAFANGNHGFIISRGCNNFVIRGNKSYDNRYSLDNQDRNAHGFMLDPGSPNSQYPQEPSFENLLENNQAWGNDGYGLRVVGSITNTIRANSFTGNLQGITLERGSTGNVVDGNTISGSTLYGIFLVGGSDGNTLKNNSVSTSGRHGIYIKTGGNSVLANTLTGNGTPSPIAPTGAGVALLPDTAVAAVADFTRPGTLASLAASDPELLGDPALASALSGNLIKDNIISGSVDDGIELKGANGTTITGNQIKDNGAHGIYLSAYESSGAMANTLSGNTLMGNKGHGIRANGALSLGNTWTQNSVSMNVAGGITNTSGANNALKPPTITTSSRTAVTGVAAPGALVEIFSDNARQGRFFEGQTRAGADGRWSFSKSQGWQGATLNATATDTANNSSGFAVDGTTTLVYLPLIRRR